MIQLLKIEWIKIQKTAVWYLLGAFILIFLYLNYDLYINFQDKFWKEASMTNDYNPWHFFINSEARKLGFCLGICTLIIIAFMQYVEVSNNMFDRIFIYPISVEKVFIAKYILVLSLIFLIIVLNLSFVLFFMKPLLSNYYAFLFHEKYIENKNIYSHWLSFYTLHINKFILFQLWLTLKLKHNYLMSFFIGLLGVLLYFINFSPYYLYFKDSDRAWTNLPFLLAYILVFLYFFKKELNNYE